MAECQFILLDDRFQLGKMAPNAPSVVIIIVAVCACITAVCLVEHQYCSSFNRTIPSFRCLRLYSSYLLASKTAKRCRSGRFCVLHSDVLTVW